MRLVRIGAVADGMELARDIPASVPGSAPLLRAGMALDTSLAAKLVPRGVRAVWIHDELGEGIAPAPPLPEEVRDATEHAVAECLSAARASSRQLPTVALGQLEAAAAGMMEALAEAPEATLAFDDLAAADTYSYTHSIRVATVGLVLGQRIARLEGWVDWRGRRRFDRVTERMTELAMGLLIHDIGKIAIPAAVLNKTTALTPEEWALVRTHPVAGASMLPAERVSALVTAIVRDHHERWDGAGYPHGRTGTEIHQFARIAAVADVYDAVTAGRPYKAATAPHVGVRAVRDGAGTQFDPGIVTHFLCEVMPYPVGHTITLHDGSTGVVVSVAPEDPDTPVVRWRDPTGDWIERALPMRDGEVQVRLTDAVR